MSIKKSLIRGNIRSAKRILIIVIMVILGVIYGGSKLYAYLDTKYDLPDIPVLSAIAEIDLSQLSGGTNYSDYSGELPGIPSGGDYRSAVRYDFSPAYSPSAYTESPCITVNGDEPYFTASEISEYGSMYGYEYYSELDSFGRCGTATALIGKETMPEEDRGDISSVKPSGWKQKKYNTNVVENGYLYNRCHLIAYMLAGENDNKLNLITGTRYFNVTGMLPLETQVQECVLRNKNHVLYRLTPIYDGNNLVASGVLMEAYSVEDSGKSLSFCRYVYNVQPGVELNYKDGSSSLE